MKRLGYLCIISALLLGMALAVKSWGEPITWQLSLPAVDSGAVRIHLDSALTVDGDSVPVRWTWDDQTRYCYLHFDAERGQRASIRLVWRTVFLTWTRADTAEVEGNCLPPWMFSGVVLRSHPLSAEDHHGARFTTWPRIKEGRP